MRVKRGWLTHGNERRGDIMVAIDGGRAGLDVETRVGMFWGMFSDRVFMSLECEVVEMVVKEGSSET